MKNIKQLGQHWLKDRPTISTIAGYADLKPDDTVLEIGPGLGTLTSELLRCASKVVAVEFDESLANNLPAQFPGKNLEVINEDILSFNFNMLPKNFKVVANIPYYITNKIISALLNTENRPLKIVLLVQKEVAERLAAGPGDMSILAISAQTRANVSLGQIVPASMFTPPPKVDSQVVILEPRAEDFFKGVDEKQFFKVVKAGFSAKRKKLRSSLSGGLNLPKDEIEKILGSINIDANQRAESLTLDDWLNLTKSLK